LNNSSVSWVPVITGDDTFFPFTLKGMDGSSTIGIPVIDRSNLIDKIKIAPANGLILVEEDYEIPQAFSHVYRYVTKFDDENEEVEVEWITIKEYLEKFGVQPDRYVDHTAKARDRYKGSYS